MVSGMVRISRYPRAAATIAKAIPVLPLVGSTSTVRPGEIVPASSAACTMAPAIRSLTEAVGLKLSSFATSSALQPLAAGKRLRRTKGVRPTKAVMSEAITMPSSNQTTERNGSRFTRVQKLD